DEVASQLRRSLAAKNCEVVGVEADESGFGAKPEITVAGLQHGVNGILRQSAISLPGLIAIPAQALVRVETPTRRSAKQHRGHGGIAQKLHSCLNVTHLDGEKNIHLSVDHEGRFLAADGRAMTQTFSAAGAPSVAVPDGVSIARV